MRETFSNNIIDHTEEVWGLDDEGEFRGCYRPSGQPGVSAQSNPSVTA
jgi:cytochrome oxidase Cu insertion factor (SCO1/SenC/PrrC family)